MQLTPLPALEARELQRKIRCLVGSQEKVFLLSEQNFDGNFLKKRVPLHPPHTLHNYCAFLLLEIKKQSGVNDAKQYLLNGNIDDFEKKKYYKLGLKLCHTKVRN